jgi:hypothetical protein
MILNKKSLSTWLHTYSLFPVQNIDLALDDSLFDKIKKSGIGKYIKSLKEMNVDFIGIPY